MRRKPAKSPANATHGAKKPTLSDALQVISKLQEQMAALQAQNPGDDDRDAESRSSLRMRSKRRGPKPKTDEWLFRKRDELVCYLEMNWPDIELYCYPTLDADRLKTVLQCLARQVPALDHLVQNFSALERFLRTDRFRGDPVQMANAMAGVPYVSFWRSLKLCQSCECCIGPGMKAVKSYVRRKHPRLYANLELNPTDLLHFIRSMRNYATREPQLVVYKQSPRQLLEAWNAAKPSLCDENLTRSG
jgi:hypothetical protein